MVRPPCDPLPRWVIPRVEVPKLAQPGLEANALVIDDALIGHVYELQPWAPHPGAPLPVDIARAESPSRFDFDQALAFGGWMLDGERVGTFAGRLANVFFGQGMFDDSDAADLATASDNPTGLSFASLSTVSVELRNRFTRDLARLRGWYAQPAMDVSDMEDAASLLFRWLVESGADSPIAVFAARSAALAARRQRPCASIPGCRFGQRTRDLHDGSSRTGRSNGTQVAQPP